MNYKKMNFKKIIDNKFTHWFKFFISSHWTTPFKFILFYILFILIGASLLYLPISLEHGYFRFSPSENYNQYVENGKLTFWDSIFIATSAFTNTGLSVTDVDYTYSWFGEFILYIWIQLGGFGLLSFFYIIGKTINRVYTKRKIVSISLVGLIERNGTKISSSGKILVSIFLINFTIQLFFSFIISFIIYAYPFNDVWKTSDCINSSAIGIANTNIEGYQNYGMALWKSLFLVGSSINNAGFDLFGSYSIAIFRNGVGIIIQIMIMILFIFGGIGYICIYDIHSKTKYYLSKVWNLISFKYFRNKYKLVIERPDNFSIFTKICLWSALAFTLISIILGFAFEYVSSYFLSEKDKIRSLTSKESLNSLFDGSGWNQNFSIIFNALSTRSAGYCTINCDDLQVSTKWLYILLMFIGTSPASTGGGIRTTTLVVSIKALTQKARNLESATIYKKRIPKKLIIESFQIFFIATIMIIFSTILFFIFEKDENIKDTSDVIFEIASSFGTTGLSTGITSNLNWFSLLLLIIIMFIGQLGITNMLTSLSSKYSYRNANSYPDLDLKIG